MRQLVFLVLLSLLFLPHAVVGQVPGGFDYQALVYESGAPLSEKAVGVKIILQDANSQAYYEEEHESLKTEKTGLLRVPIGEGKVLQGSLADVPWGKGILVAASMNTGTGYRVLGPAVRLQAVPYALRARSNPTLRGTASNRASDSPIFEVVNSKGKAVFSVYEEGVKMRVAGDLDEAVRQSGFSVSTRKLDGTDLVRRVHLDEGMRFQVDEETGRGVRGGFAVSTYSMPLRGGEERVETERMWLSGPGMGFVLDDGTRGVRGGFAVSRRTLAGVRSAFSVDGGLIEARVDPATRGVRGGFAVSLRSNSFRDEEEPLEEPDVVPLMVLDDKESYLTVAGRLGEEGTFSFRERQTLSPLVSVTAEGNLMTEDGDASSTFKALPKNANFTYTWAAEGILDPFGGSVVSIALTNAHRAAHLQDAMMQDLTPGMERSVEVRLRLDTENPLFEGLEIREIFRQRWDQTSEFPLGLSLAPDYVIREPRTISAAQLHEALEVYLADDPSLSRAIEFTQIELKPEYLEGVELQLVHDLRVHDGKAFGQGRVLPTDASAHEGWEGLMRNVGCKLSVSDDRISLGRGKYLNDDFTVEIEDPEAFFRDGGTKEPGTTSGQWRWSKTIQAEVESVALENGKQSVPLQVAGEFAFQ